MPNRRRPQEPRSGRPVRVAIIEDSPDLRFLLKNIIQVNTGVEVAGDVESAEHAVTDIDWTDVDVAVSDLELPGADGAWLFDWLHDHHPHVLRILLTGSHRRPSLRAHVVYDKQRLDGSEFLRTLRTARR